MAKNICYEPSRTLNEFRLLPGHTTISTTIDKISIKTPLVYSETDNKKYCLNIPIVSSAMQSVSGEKIGIELAKFGGVAFIFCSQPIKSQAEMITKIKNYKAGFVEPKTVSPYINIKDLHEIRQHTGYSTFPVVDDNNVFLGLITKYDYDVLLHGPKKVIDRMIPADKIEIGMEITELKQANSLLMETHQSVLPIVDKEYRLLYLVFRKDIRDHLNNPLEVVDEKKRLLSVAAINTHDYKERIPALVEAEVDLVSIDSSDGFSFYQKEAIEWINRHYPELPVIGGNIITPDGFDFLIEAGACAVKVGMGGGSICITQEQKGTGRGLATAIIKVCEARDRYYTNTGKYIPIIADGGISNAKDIVIALALGADYVMMGRYFARMEESPTEKVIINNRVMKPYWGEGSSRAREWKSFRYNQVKFTEGVEGFVEYAGYLKDNLEETLTKIKSTMATCGVSNIQELHKNAELELVSALSIREGKVHDIHLPGEGTEGQYHSRIWGDGFSNK